MSDEQKPINERFRSLDDYLAWLRKTQAPIDGAWYKQTGPDTFELQTGGNLHLDVPRTEKSVFTRAELEAKLGFSH